MKNFTKNTWIPVVIIGTIIVAIYTFTHGIIPNWTGWNESFTTLVAKYDIDTENYHNTLFILNIKEYLKGLRFMDELSMELNWQDALQTTQQQLPTAPSGVDVIAWLRYIAKIVPNTVILVINTVILVPLNIAILTLKSISYGILGIQVLVGIPIGYEGLANIPAGIVSFMFTVIPLIKPIPFI